MRVVVQMVTGELHDVDWTPVEIPGQPAAAADLARILDQRRFAAFRALDGLDVVLNTAHVLSIDFTEEVTPHD
ncbi:hypothetical protein [Georgenia wangjunii]|uniref:hypothetical protein n=1 Tax=Georgenia wangjunii TaxID=3117730 RepID=UPI002F25F143